MLRVIAARISLQPVWVLGSYSLERTRLTTELLQKCSIRIRVIHYVLNSSVIHYVLNSSSEKVADRSCTSARLAAFCTGSTR